MAHITNLNTLGTCKNNTQAKCGEQVFYDWETGLITSDPFRAVDLEKEGYKIVFNYHNSKEAGGVFE